MLRGVLLVSAIFELLRYEFWMRCGGFRRVTRQMQKPARRAILRGLAKEEEIMRAMDLALTFYWNPVQCLHRSIAAARLLRKYGFPAKLMIGCRTEPFLSHAWVEVGDRAVNDSPVYRHTLPVLMQL
jgi:hypothetical protein